MSPVAAHESIFPLNYHSEVLVVEQQNLHGQFLAMQSRQFLNVHLETTIAIDIDHQRAWISGLHTMAAGRPNPSCRVPMN